MKNAWEKLAAWISVNQDKLLHLTVFGWFVYLGLDYSILVGIICFLLMAVLSVIKEYVLDKEADNMDIWFGLFGGILAFVFKLINGWIV